MGMRMLRLCCYLALGFALLLSGCGSSKKDIINVRGRIVDNAGNGVAAATVMFEGRAEIATTAADGSYSFVNIPPGTYTVLATKQGYIAMGEPKAKGVQAQRTRVEVVVVSNKLTTVPDIIIMPGGQSVDTLAVSQVTPQLNTGLEAGSSVSLNLSVNYCLKSVDEGHVITVLYIRNSSTTTKFRSVSKVVEKGTGSLNLALDFQVPYTQIIFVETLLTDVDGVSLASNSTPAYYVTSKAAPSPPEVKVEKASLSHVELSFSGGNLYDFKSLELHRITGYNSIKVATITPLDTTYVDTNAIEGVTYDYFTRLFTSDNRWFDSKNARVTVPQVGIEEEINGVNVANSTFIMDPQRNVLYMADHENQQFKVINMDNYAIISSKVLPKMPTLMAITPDGSTIYGPAAGVSEIIKINTNTLTVATVNKGISVPKGIAVHPSGNTIYVSNGQAVFAVDTATGVVLSTNSTVQQNTPLVVNAEGTYLFILGQFVDVLDSQTLNKVYSYPYDNGYEPLPSLNKAYNELFFRDGSVYEATSPWRRIDKVVTPYWGRTIGSSQDGNLLFIYGQNSEDLLLAVFKKVGLTWQEIERIYLWGYASIKSVYSTVDNKKVCFLGASKGWSGDPNYLTCINLAERAAAR